jgi:threonine/homoserine/homoserine lactone efflux protein
MSLGSPTAVMGFGEYAAFQGVCLLVICTPGPDTALTIRNTLWGGRRGGVSTAAGVAAGQSVWTAATSAGLAVALAASAPLFLAIRLAGGAYLCYLGSRSVLRAFTRVDPGRLGGSSAPARLSPRSAVVQGLLSNLTNAKMVAFFIGLLPPFGGPHPSFLFLFLLGLNFCALTFGWLVLYTLAVDRVSGWFRNSRVSRAIDVVMGATLVGLGLRTAADGAPLP